MAALSRAKIMSMVKKWYIEGDKQFHWKEIHDRTMLTGLHEVDPNVHNGFQYTWYYPHQQDGNILHVYVDYTVCFGEMTQKNESTQTVRKLLWSLSTDAERTSADTEGCKWLVKVEGEGVWCELDDELVHCALCQNDKTYAFQCGQYDYILDLRAMKQKNMSTGKERDVVVASGGMRFRAEL